MSTITSVAQQQEASGNGALAAILAFLKRCWVAYMTWRIEQAALATLRAMSDQDLNDLGVARSGIEEAVRGRRDMTARA